MTGNKRRTVEIINYFLSNKKILLPCVAAGVLFFVIYALFLPTEYTSSATILPSGSSSGPLGMAYGLVPGLAERLTESGISSVLFSDILRSRVVVLAVAKEPFDSTLRERTGVNNMAEYYGWSSDDEIVKGFWGGGRVSYSFDKGITKITFTSSDKYLSYFVVKTWLNKLTWFIEEHLETEARRNYEYMKQRLAAAEKSLREAEDSLKIFIKTHRNYNTDPVENIKYNDLLMLVESKRSIYQTLLQQVESARIDMVKSLPTVKILDEPYIPHQKSGPKRSLIVSIGFILGLIIGILWIEIKELLSCWKNGGKNV